MKCDSVAHRNYLFRLADYGAAAGVYEKLLEWLTAVDDASPVADVHCAVYLNMARWET